MRFSWACGLATPAFGAPTGPLLSPGAPLAVPWAPAQDARALPASSARPTPQTLHHGVRRIVIPRRQDRPAHAVSPCRPPWYTARAGCDTDLSMIPRHPEFGNLGPGS